MTQESLDKKKGIPDIVFLLDASGSMSECIRAVTQNISTFVDTLSASDANGGVLIKDWRIRVLADRDKQADGSYWFIDNPFTSDIAEVKAQLVATTEEAVARGAFGAPTFFVGEQLFFGQDRLDFVRQALAA